ncbi:MAG: ornithine cyclodeaminase/alanine dehydrogenase-like protein (mu-crystallin family) [Halieaceae bacterium]|jgi:ornithine cyclodeaminase/alanine dehydrogenase-like protein (mu-crystallin family)
MKIITQSQVEKHLPMAECIAAMGTVMQAVSAGRTHLPIRQFMPVTGTQGKLAIMPGVIDDPWCFGIKLVCKYVRPPESPFGSHVGMVMLFDAEQGFPLAMIEGSSLTGIRTAAASAFATDLLARPEAARLLVIGCGEQARRHITALRCVRDIRSIAVWGRNPARVQSFVADTQERERIPVSVVDKLPEAIGQADIICTVTASADPILEGKHLAAGTHLNLVGSAVPTNSEVDICCVEKSRYFVDYRPATMAAAGELLKAIAAGAVSKEHIVAEIGEVAAGNRPGRESDKDITLYKSLGVAAQDLAAAHLLYTRAQDLGFGTDIVLNDLNG